MGTKQVLVNDKPISVLNNPDFKTPEFGGIRMEAGSNRFYLSVNQFVEKTNVDLFSKAGRYGGTYAHRDIATILPNRSG